MQWHKNKTYQALDKLGQTSSYTQRIWFQTICYRTATERKVSLFTLKTRVKVKRRLRVELAVAAKSWQPVRSGHVPPVAGVIGACVRVCACRPASRDSRLTNTLSNKGTYYCDPLIRLHKVKRATPVSNETGWVLTNDVTTSRRRDRHRRGAHAQACHRQETTRRPLSRRRLLRAGECEAPAA